MQRPGHKINTREPNPNAYITFIRALEDKADAKVAEQILKAIAAQVQKIMEQRYMYINTLEEAKYNGVFAGRNWNHGQTVELVLRRPDGRFYPLPYIMSVMCHEMAHITHMNHGKDFQALMAAIKQDVREMQARGYYGDGFWSDGKRLKDGARLGAEGLKQSDFPDYICGVSKADARKARRPTRGPASSRTGLVKGEASHRSGRQTEYRRKAGRKNNVDMGEATGRLDGRREVTKEDRKLRIEQINARTETLVRSGLSTRQAKTRATAEWDEQNPWFKSGSTHGKKAASKTAAQLRAEAAERRLLGMKQEVKEEDTNSGLESMAGGSETGDLKPGVSDDEDDDIIFIKVEDPHLSAADRRRELEDEMSDSEREELKGGWEEYLPTGSKRPSSALETAPGPSAPRVKREHASPSPGSKPHASSSQPASARPSPAGSSAPTDLVRQERLRAYGLAPTSSQNTSHVLGGSKGGVSKRDDLGDRSDWQCPACTFINKSSNSRCEMCDSKPDGSWIA